MNKQEKCDARELDGVMGRELWCVEEQTRRDQEETCRVITMRIGFFSNRKG